MLEGTSLTITCEPVIPDTLPAIERKILVNGTLAASGSNSQQLTHVLYQLTPTGEDGMNVTCQLENALGSSSDSEIVTVYGKGPSEFSLV